MKILMVCLGNICRSPIAEGVMKHKIQQHGLNWIVDSAGTESYHIGEPPHRYSQKICLANGIDISRQRARKFTAADFSQYDIIYAMATDVHDAILRIGGRNTDPARLDYFLNELYQKELGVSNSEFGLESIYGFEITKDASVPDPWYGEEDGYTIVFDLIDKACDAIIANYKNL